MKRLLAIIFGFTAITATAQEKKHVQEYQKPNIVLIVADDLGIGDISGLNPNSKIATPNIDKLMAKGMTFTDAHSSASISSASRYSLLTGQYAWRTPLKKGELNGYSPALINDTTDTAPALLKRIGYKTALFGVWQLGWNWTLKDTGINQNKETNPLQSVSENRVDFSKPFTEGPVDHGFDYFYGIPAEPGNPPYVFCENDHVTKLPTKTFPGAGGTSKKDMEANQKLQRKGLMAPEYDVQKTLKHITDHSIDYIKHQNSTSPFFLMVALSAPHTPVLPRKEFQGTSGAGSYGDFVQELDWSVGQIIKALKKKGLEDNTIIIFTADNGASRISFPLAFEKKYNHFPSRELHGRKGTLHEGGHHVPFVIQWKNNIRSNSKNDDAICLADLYATFAQLTGSKTGSNQGPDSFSFYGLLQGRQDYQRKSTVYTNSAGRFSIRKGDWKLDLNPKPDNRKLFNLKTDRGEKHNLYGGSAYKDIEQQLMQEITSVVENGRSTPGTKLSTGKYWPQLYWLSNAKKKKIKVFFLAGQSNMDGRARAYHLTENDLQRLEKAKRNVTLYFNHEPPVPLQPTKANEYIRNRFNTKEVFGPELFFGINLSEAYPNDKIILIKRSKGGMSLYGAWNPEWSQEKAALMNEQNEPHLYDDFISYAHEVLSSFDTSDYELCGMLWVQGETDSSKKHGPKPADSYQDNLTKLIKDVRQEFSAPTLPFIIFQVGNQKVVQAMKNIADNDPDVSLIPQSYDKESEDFYTKNPPPLGHYTYKSMKKIGEEFFNYYQNYYAK